MLTTNILQRVLKVRCGNACGTAFTVDIENKQYLISAKHIFENSSGDIEVRRGNENMWIKVDTKPIFHDEEMVDIAVMPLHRLITPNHKLIPQKGNYFLSQDAYFLGFPFGFEMGDKDSRTHNNDYPIPFVKKCIISAFSRVTTPTGSTVQQIYLDGHNNIGFSGGPVIFQGIPDKEEMHVFGVVSSYFHDLDPEKKDLGLRENSGLFLCYSMGYAMEIIDKIKA